MHDNNLCLFGGTCRFKQQLKLVYLKLLQTCHLVIELKSATNPYFTDKGVFSFTNTRV